MAWRIKGNGLLPVSWDRQSLQCIDPEAGEMQRIDFIGSRFHTLIGAIFLVIVLVSPGGLIGLWDRLLALFSGRRQDPGDRTPVDVAQAEPSA
jgi:hypothetical protein